MNEEQKTWEGKYWSVSPHNFDKEIAIRPHKVELHDITVRDGEECADLAYTVDDKVRIIEAVANAGVTRSELFLSTPGWLESVQAVMRRKLPIDLYVDYRPGRIEKAWNAGVRHVMVWYWINEYLEKLKFNKSRKELLDMAAEQIRHSVENGCHVNVFIPDCSRAPLPMVKQAAEMARDAGAHALTMVDSYGVMRPQAVRFLVEKMREWSGLELDVHCHNDYGLATANVLAAYEGGAVGLNVCVNGVGYRAGNAPLEEVAVALKTLYGADPGIKPEMLPWLSKMVEDITGIQNGYFKPIVGKGAFSVEQWGMSKAFEDIGKLYYSFGFQPEYIGLKPRVVVGKWSDPGAVEKKLRDYGLTANAEQVADILIACHRAGLAHHRPLRDDEFIKIATNMGAHTSGD
jgi:isopropylmalate/homocitrate/citramalate synthase